MYNYSYLVVRTRNFYVFSLLSLLYTLCLLFFHPSLFPPPSLQRWFVDGSVQCFAGGHVPLGLLAILVLLVCLTLIPVVALIALDIQHPKVSVLYMFII